MNLKTIAIASAVGSLLALGSTAASAADAPAKEKCAGIAASGQNDCATSKHSCAGQAKTDHIRQEPPIGGVDGQIRKAGQHVGEHVEPSGLTEHCSRLITGGQQSLDNGDALGNDHATPIRPDVRVGEVAEVR